MFGFLAACVVVTEITKTAVDKTNRKRMTGRLPTNTWRENGKNRWIKNSTWAALNLLCQPSDLILDSLAALQMLASPHPITARLHLLLTVISLPFSFQFFTCLSPVFAEKVDDYFVFISVSPIHRCFSKSNGYVNIRLFGDK